ncbi:hypothetical protein OKA04_05505 [Luteolibacter flavescens]|uniref:SLA1 homology domain-containing protein n=1 Tax=Luteolibacter flavescens TaxID=1859460 RepID=A0ABT3FKT0_9BACT|nr:hypothetical protein [Luteolibacter flavescens]MCW1884177.1 hypothetical protein [Luteolibacter flavescens]
MRSCDAVSPWCRRSIFSSAAAVLLALASTSSAQEASTGTRVWTNTAGKTITAEYLGIRGNEVVLGMQGGKISFIPLASLSTADNDFVRANRLDYHARWRGWPVDASQAMPGLTVAEEAGGAREFVYTTKNFRFHCDVELGTTLMKDLARTFELTLQLHSKSPFGVLAKPEKDRFEAQLFGTLADYRSAGAPSHSAGVYMPKKKIFLAPLELMGIRPGPAGHRKVSDEYDISTIVHELTHMLTHDMLANLPLWVNEGYAEYIATIPIQAGTFRTDREKIREGVRDSFVTTHLKRITRPDKELPKWGKAQRETFLKTGALPGLRRVADMLQMTDEEWTSGSRQSVRTPFGTQFTPPTPHDLPQLYRTAHLIIYYFIEIEGEKGVEKLRKFLEENRRNMDRYEQYFQDVEDYEKAMVGFLALPGVTKLPDGKFRYPSHLKPPKAPEGSPPDLKALKLGGLPALLNGESAEAVGSRIEEALRKDLNMNLQFN